MEHKNINNIDGHKIERVRYWDSLSVRCCCVNNNFYTEGNNEEYTAMLNRVEKMEPTTAAMYLIASDIAKHSEYQTITNVMYCLEKEAVYTTFTMDDEA